MTSGPVQPHKTSALSGLLDRLVPSRAREKRLGLEMQRLEAFLKSIPIEFCGWNRQGVQAISPGFCNLLGVAGVKSVVDIAEALSPGDGAALHGFFDRLQAEGARFALAARTADGARSLKIMGQRGAVFSGEEIFDVIWIEDVTDITRATVTGAQALTETQKREAELRLALDNLPFPVWMRDEDFNISWCNRAYAALMGATAATVVAEQKELSLSGAQGKSLRMLAQQALSEGASKSLKTHVVTGGDRRMMEIFESAIRGEEFLVGCAFDVTDFERVQADLDRYRRTHDEILEHLRTAIAIFDAHTRLVFFNTAFAHLWGASETWLNGKPRLGDFLETLREQRRLPEQADFRQFKQEWQGWFTGLLSPHEEMLYLPDGAALRMIAAPYPEGGLIFTFEDVTSRLELETSYNTLIAVQRETLDNLSEGLAVFGEDGRLQLSNPAWARLWKLQPEDLEGKPHVSRLVEKMRGFFPPEKWETMRNELVACGLERIDRKARLTREDGSVLDYIVVALPDGAILNAFFDITDSVNVERALREKTAALEEAERLKLDFLANVSYQLRTPLNAIMGFAEILNEQYFGQLNERQKEYTDGIIDAGQRLVSLINDILDLSTIEAGYLSLYPSEVDVARVLQSIDDLTQEWVRKQNSSLRVECAANAGSIVADERRFKQVIINLVSNAINFSPRGGEIVVLAKRDAGDLVVSVTDHGEGIPEEDLKRIFQPFERSRRERKRHNSGAGLGLSLVKRIVELHGGMIDIKSAPGAGTTVTCRFPLVAVIPQSDAAKRTVAR